MLLLEAGGSDDVPQVMDPLQWPVNLGSERDWGFTSEPSTALNGRSILLSMGKVLGGVSSINVMVWAADTRTIGTNYAAASGDNPGDISRCSTSTDASRTGTASQIPAATARAVRSMSSRRRGRRRRVNGYPELRQP